MKGLQIGAHPRHPRLKNLRSRIEIKSQKIRRKSTADFADGADEKGLYSSDSSDSLAQPCLWDVPEKAKKARCEQRAFG